MDQGSLKTDYAGICGKRLIQTLNFIYTKVEAGILALSKGNNMNGKVESEQISPE